MGDSSGTITKTVGNDMIAKNTSQSHIRFIKECLFIKKI